MSQTLKRKRAGLNATAYSFLIHALLTGPRSKAELEAISGVGTSLSSRLLKALRDRGLLYVSGWRIDARGRMTIREYSLGLGQKDAPCPKLSRAEIVARYLQNKRTRRARKQEAPQSVPA